MPATSAEAIERKAQRANERRKERRRTDPDFSKRETRSRAARPRSRGSAKSPDARDRARAQARSKQDARPFVGCDGEGIGRDPHRYALFRMGDRELFADDQALGTADLLAFIVAHPDPTDILVGFAFDYDVNMILRDLPEDRWRHLLGLVAPSPDAKIAPNPYDRNGGWTWVRFGARLYGVQYIPRNHLRVCQGISIRDRDTWRTVAHPGTTRTIYDTWGFFQGTFLKALERWDIGAEHRPAIKAGKDARASFAAITADIRTYCAIECRLLAEMMEAFRTACLGAGIRPRTWNGAGKLAAAMMRDHGVIRKADVEKRCPAGLLRLAHEAYYGGRFEVTRCGLIEETVTEHDIRSAYPAAMLDLPCLEHGAFRKADGAQLARAHKRGESGGADPPLFVCGVQFKHRQKSFLCGLPFRSAKDGTLSWPRTGRGVYWSPEIRSAEKLGAKVKLTSGYLYEKRCDCQPFAWIEEVYEHRRQLEAIGDGRGVPLKLGPNSIYGKFAQRIGHPPYANPIYAGLCTAITRAKLNDAIAATGDPRRVIMIATDAVYTIGKPPRLPIGEGLGEWERKRYRSLFVVRPGVYWPPKKRGKAQAIKSRGLSPKFLEPMIRKFRRTWADYIRRKKAGAIDPKVAALYGRKPLPPPVVLVQLTTFVGHRLALHHRKIGEACQWITREQRQAFECHNSTKRWPGRTHGKSIIMPPRQGDEFKRSHVVAPNALLQTEVPLPSEQSMLFDDQPDPLDLSPPHID